MVYPLGYARPCIICMKVWYVSAESPKPGHKGEAEVPTASSSRVTGTPTRSMMHACSAVVAGAPAIYFSAACAAGFDMWYGDNRTYAKYKCFRLAAFKHSYTTLATAMLLEWMFCVILCAHQTTHSCRLADHCSWWRCWLPSAAAAMLSLSVATPRLPGSVVALK
ncbi:hypothetical protein COO60DRAFT_847477 [Scenedesmus sp. NREL 46B-D3]|nr:hypothetical protein COO60DRAFT_847477 [Scenedesmus sp. NREL 46B-D3]